MADYAIAENDRLVELAPAAGATELAFDFPVLEDDEIRVTRTRDGTAAVLTLTTDYTVAGLDAEAGGTVTLTAASLAGDAYRLEGRSAHERLSDYAFRGALKTAALNDDFDRLWMTAQEHRRDIDGHETRLDVIESGVANADASLLTTGTLPDARLSAGVHASLDLADSATQPGDLAAVATSGDAADLTGTLDDARLSAAAQASLALADSALQEHLFDEDTSGTPDADRPDVLVYHGGMSLGGGTPVASVNQLVHITHEDADDTSEGPKYLLKLDRAILEQRKAAAGEEGTRFLHGLNLTSEIGPGFGGQSYWGVGSIAYQVSPRHGENAVGMSSEVRRSLDASYEAAQDGTGNPEGAVDGQAWAFHGNIQDQTGLSGADTIPSCGFEISLVVSGPDDYTNRVLPALADISAVVKEHVPTYAAEPGAGMRSIIRAIAKGYDDDTYMGGSAGTSSAVTGLGIYVSPGTTAGGGSAGGLRGTLRTGVLIDDTISRDNGNPQVVGYGLDVRVGGYDGIHVGGDSDNGIRITGEYSQAAITIENQGRIEFGRLTGFADSANIQFNESNGKLDLKIGNVKPLAVGIDRVSTIVPFELAEYTVATAPAATAGAASSLIYVSDGDAGAPCLAVCDGASWLRVPLGAAISAT